MAVLVPGPLPKTSSSERQTERGRERQVTEAQQRRPAEVHQRAGHGRDQSEQHPLDEADEQRRVAERIGPRQQRGEPERREQQRGGEQKHVAAAAPQPPHQTHGGEPGEVEGRPAQHQPTELGLGADRETGLHQRQLRGGEDGHLDGRGRAAPCRSFPGRAHARGELGESGRGVDRGGRYLGAEDRGNVGQGVAGLPRRGQERGQLPRRQPAIRGRA